MSHFSWDPILEAFTRETTDWFTNAAADTNGNFRNDKTGDGYPNKWENYLLAAYGRKATFNTTTSLIQWVGPVCDMADLTALLTKYATPYMTKLALKQTPTMDEALDAQTVQACKDLMGTDQ